MVLPRILESPGRNCTAMKRRGSLPVFVIFEGASAGIHATSPIELRMRTVFAPFR